MYKVTCDEEFIDFYRRLFLRNSVFGSRGIGRQLFFS